MRRIAALALILVFTAAGAAQARRMSVAVPKANVRSGPGTKYEVMWQADQFYPVLVQECQDDWCYFTDFEGHKGWLHNSLLNSVKSVVTTKNKCNLRSGPGTNNKKVGIVDSRVPFKVLKTSGRWIKVEHKTGLVGWIHSSLVW